MAHNGEKLAPDVEILERELHQRLAILSNAKNSDARLRSMQIAGRMFANALFNRQEGNRQDIHDCLSRVLKKLSLEQTTISWEMYFLVSEMAPGREEKESSG